MTRLTETERQQRNEKIFTLQRSGMSYTEIATAMDMPRSTVGEIIRIHGSSPKRPDKPSKKGQGLKGGIELNGHRVVAQKPTVSPAKLLIRTLEPGRGFTAEELSEGSGLSIGSIENAAKQMKCRWAVEVSPDNWQHLIMEPATAQRYAK